MKKRNIVFLVFAILTTAFIFSNSLQVAEVSSGQSGTIVKAIVQAAKSIKMNLPEEMLVTFVRKCAHITEFFLLGLFWSGVFITNGAIFLNRLIYVLFIGLFTACCDEFIQFFVDGRGSLVSDVFIDFSGIVLAVLAGLLIEYSINRRRRRIHGPIR